MDWLFPTYLIALFAVPVAMALYVWSAFRRREAMRRFGNHEIVKQLSQSISPRLRRWKSAFAVIGLALIATSIAGPRFGTKLREFKREGVDLVIALDVSQSMLAEDVLPNRLTRAKYEIGKLLENLEGDRVGLVLFAGDAFVQCPLTLDYSAVRLFLDIADPSQIPTPGTDFSAALNKTVQVFTGAAEKEEGAVAHTRALLIVSDGENFAPVDEALDAAEKAGLIIFATGVGESDGVPVPVYQHGRQVGFKKDKGGNTVVTRLEEDRLKELSENGGYFQITRQSSSLGEMAEALKRLDRQAFDAEIFEEYEEKYQWPLALGILLLLFEFLFPDRFVGRVHRPGAYVIAEGEEETGAPWSASENGSGGSGVEVATTAADGVRGS
ncbi:MAG TPA: VWA domain-containing protein [Rhodothermales bacterium]|nr:VWA domain-containing protein [Rhodothermales bacterium]